MLIFSKLSFVILEVNLLTFLRIITYNHSGFKPLFLNRYVIKNLKDSKPTKRIGSWIVFLFCLIIVSTSLVSVVFPALISSSVGYSEKLQGLGLSQKIDPFELGVSAIPLFISSVVVLGIAFLYFKNKIPKPINEIFVKLFRFEISKRITTISMIIIFGIYIAMTAGELENEEIWLDYENLKTRISWWDISQVIDLSEPHVKYFLVTTSMELFGNYAVIPFIASIALLVTVYYITKEIAKKRFAGIIAVIIVMQSNTFLTYDTSVTYDNFWMLFYLLSLYSVIKIWPVSPIIYLISIPSKALTTVFLPMSLFFVYRANIQRKRKLILLGTYAAIGIIGIIAITSFNTSLSGIEQTESNLGFWQGFSAMAFQTRFDILITLFLMPLIVGLFVASRHGYEHADSILVLIGMFLLTAPLLTGFTYITNQPYRFVPLVVFFAMGIGVLLSRTTQDE